MKYIKFELSDGIPVKFKVRKLFPRSLDIEWKYVDKLNFAKYIDLDVPIFAFHEEVEAIQEASDEQLIDAYRNLIEDEHSRLAKIKRNI